MKSTIKLGLLVGALCGLNNLNADVPHVFEDGEVIRAEEMNENFASINSEITTIKADVENNSGSSWSEETISKACLEFENDFNPISDMRASSKYRNLVAKNLLKKYFIELSKTEKNTNVLRVEI